MKTKQKQTLIEKAERLYEKGDYDGAIADYTEAISLYDNNEDLALIHIYRAAAYINKSDYHHVMADANTAIKLGHQLAEAHLVRGIACLHLGPMGQAIVEWKKAADYGSKGALKKLEEYGVLYTPLIRKKR
jgi:tetratricopeptide (TPR) repeat protein